MEKENFLGKLRKLVELAKSKQNALDVTEINNFFMGDNLQTEQMEQIYNYLEQNNIDVIPEVIDDSILKENDSMLDDDVDDEFLKNEEEDRSVRGNRHGRSGPHVPERDRYRSASERGGGDPPCKAQSRG